MEPTKPLRIGLVGCGYQGGIFAQTIARMPSLQLVACADPDQQAAARVAGGAPTFVSVEELLSAATVDAVIVATSHDALYECALAAIQAHKAVLVEKPIGMDETEAAQLEDAVAQNDVCFMSGYSFRFFPALQKVHELLRAGAIGEVHTACGAIGTAPMLSGWISSTATGGGPLLYVGSHLVDELLWLMGDRPVEVAATVRYRADTHADDTTTFELKLAHGAVVQGMVTQAVDTFFNTLEFYGRSGMISLRSVIFNYTVELTQYKAPDGVQPLLMRFPSVADLRLVSHQQQLAEFVQAVNERRQPSVTVHDGRVVLRVLDAIARSGRTGAAVRLAQSHR